METDNIVWHPKGFEDIGDGERGIISFGVGGNRRKFTTGGDSESGQDSKGETVRVGVSTELNRRYMCTEGLL